LRSAALVVEETAWLAARFPGRVGLGVAAGALPLDFEIAGVTKEELAARFSSGLAFVTRALSGDIGAPLAADAAVARCRDHPVPVLSAAASVTAARRAAASRAGLLFDSLVTPDRVRVLVDAYREAGGTGPAVLVRRAWVGEPPRAAVRRQIDRYATYAPGTAAAHWGADEMAIGDPSEVADALADAVVRAGTDALNLRVHVPGVSVDAAREQIVRLGSEVVPRFR
jgi:alkanesulfonate monooxygenase SsuD/methylene tetrahydromethanopterin reductase-like flavin-dependent oxidoreductase (luciferase family)